MSSSAFQLRYQSGMLPRICVVLLALCCGGEELGCQLGDRVLAFYAGDSCELSMPQCWMNATVADGPGRGDAFITVLWQTQQSRFQRLHASYARRERDGKRCLEPYAVAQDTKCTGRACNHYEDVVQDVVGDVLRDALGNRLECGEALQFAHQCVESVRVHCPDTCRRIERRLRRGTRPCYSPRRTLPLLKRFAQWKWYSQAMQDSVLHLLLLRPEGAVPLADDRAPFFVEFGYSWHLLSNSEYLRRAGWQGVRFDLNFSQPSALLFSQAITPANIVDVFKRHNVPAEVDFVSIDIDSCDVWVFLSLVAPSSPFRPRVVQIEYNRHFNFDETIALDCSSGAPPWEGDGGWPFKNFGVVSSNIYGASLPAIAAAAKSRGYSVVWVERCYDVFLVRDDLVCPGEGLDLGLEHFRDFVAKQGEDKCKDGIEWFAQDVGEELRRRWVREFIVHSN